MPLQNRVQPTGDIIAHEGRGTLMGNRGILHNADRTLGKTRWHHPHWVTCALTFKGRRRPLMAPGNYTELFFLDETVALAAGHRPCAECRRQDYLAFRRAWDQAFGERPPLAVLDRQMHASRIDRNAHAQRRHKASSTDLPDGTFVLHNDHPHLIWHSKLVPCSADGYGQHMALPAAQSLLVLTPAVTVAVLRAGYRPNVHSSAEFGQVP